MCSKQKLMKEASSYRLRFLKKPHFRSGLRQLTTEAGMDFMAGGGASGVGPPDATSIIIIRLAGRALSERISIMTRIPSNIKTIYCM